MKKFSHNSIVNIAVVAFALTLAVAGPSSVFAATAVGLGSADSFAALAGSAITDTTPSVITGNVGLSPASGTFYLSPILTTGEVTGTIYATNAAGPAGAAGNNPILVGAAQVSLTAAYTNAANQTPFTTLPGGDNQLGSLVLAPGIYRFGGAATANLIGNLTLDGQGDPNAVFIFQASSTLLTASGATVTLINSAQACNVFWQVGTSATFGTGTTFKGTVMADQSITDNGGSTIEGRLLASIAALTLNNTHLTKPVCVSPPPPPAVVTSGGSCGASSSAPLINVTAIPNPLALPSGPASVTYTYVATNVGVSPMNNVSVVDNSCGPIAFISGDTNNNGLLDVGESWTYSCATMLSQTVTSTVTAHGAANCWDAYDTANATVVVGVPALPNTGVVVPPLIHLLKTPNVFLLPAGGGAVTYTYTVTNPGTVPLNNVSVTDDRCTGLPGLVLGNPGDLNHNNMLENNETWYFTCFTGLTQTTTNTGTAEGSANGLTAIDFSPATVVVLAPSLPNTGFYQTANASNMGMTRAEGMAAFWRSLGIGSQGPDVVALQSALEQKGLLTMPYGVAKGYFGMLTRAAVLRYQANSGLPMAGMFGPMTRARLISELGQ